MYNVTIQIINLQTFATHNETVKFYSRWASRKMAREYASCEDVLHVEIIDNTTGEIVLELGAKGEVLWDTEG